ncbi:uncharacterized protein LOC6736649 [Drosophila simulans]|uniref:GD13326 n=1 Tax=Drosophila simulans TaxID=7240 RepID=B4QPJ7_DROSI|nr:uncharacterized protein LOC6736649 [Drosophila simulans]EDX09090.1 GD13326 [Drosophila simulans]KMY97370.1 uncharacterized protein Dsimw501_GD13326 [Drosophila simulans]
MFRLQQSQPDPAEEQKRVAAEVRFNFILFGAVIAAVRLAPVVLKHLNTA